MNFVPYIKTVVYLLTKCNVPKTVYINFKKFPVKVAVKFPIYVYGKTTFRSLSGNIIIKGNVHSGMIKIGKNDFYVKTAVPLTVWTLNGTLIFGGSCKFLNGGYLCVSKKGILELGNDILIGTDYKIMCYDSIRIGNTLRAAYNIQIYDTSYHYVENEKGEVKGLTKPIVIGDRVWIGNTSIVTKGSKISDGSIVTNNSLVNKDFSNYKNVLIAGIPAQIKKNGVFRIFDAKREKYLDEQFGYDRTHL